MYTGMSRLGSPRNYLPTPRAGCAPGTGGMRPWLAASAATAASRAARMMGHASAALATTCSAMGMQVSNLQH